MLPLAANPRAKMQGIRDGFVKLFSSKATGIVIGGVVVSPRASELVHVVSLSVSSSLTVDHVADAFTIYPSLSGSVAEAARRLHRRRLSACNHTVVVPLVSGETAQNRWSTAFRSCLMSCSGVPHLFPVLPLFTIGLTCVLGA